MWLTKTEQWEMAIPYMGIFALARNLRNFDEAGVSDLIKDSVCSKLEDPEVIAKSRMFPYRWFQAYRAAPSLDWGKSLERALEASCSNIPKLEGRSLILIDTSGSMSSSVSVKSNIQLFEIGALFAAAMARKNPTTSDVVIFGDSSAPFPVKPGESTLKYINRVKKANGSVGHGTAIWQSVIQNYSDHDRVVIFTDMQTMDSSGNPQEHSYWGSRNNPSYKNKVKNIPFIHGFNLSGYRVTTIPTGTGRFEYGGFTDSSFTLMKELENSSLF